LEDPCPHWSPKVKMPEPPVLDGLLFADFQFTHFC